MLKLDSVVAATVPFTTLLLVRRIAHTTTLCGLLFLRHVAGVDICRQTDSTDQQTEKGCQYDKFAWHCLDKGSPYNAMVQTIL